MLMSTKKTARCLWCGKEFIKSHNRQVCCSKECQDNLTAENWAKASMKYYYKNKVGNINKRNLTDLGSKGTTQTCHRLEDFDEEYKWIQEEKKRLGLKF